VSLGTREATREFLAFGGEEPRAGKMEGRAPRALRTGVAELRPPLAVCAEQKFAMAKAEHQKAMRTHRTSTSCKIHGKRLAAFRETLEVRTRRRVAFNQDVALDSVYNPKSPSRVHETDSPFRHWTFPKKEPEFRLFSVSSLQVSKRQLDSNS